MSHGCPDPALSSTPAAMDSGDASGLPPVGDGSGDARTVKPVLSPTAAAIVDSLRALGGAATEDDLVEILSALEHGLAAWAALREVGSVLMLERDGQRFAALNPEVPVPVFPDAARS